MNSKKVRSKVSKLIEKSDSENDDNEHELSFYVNDRVQLMKEVLKIIKPKKIKSMAPDCIKDLDIEEINSMLLEELLGISNKRLKYIFNAQNPAEDSSSTDPEDENKPIDIISLDDVSDDDFIIEIDSDKPKKKKHNRVKDEPRVKKIKREKPEKSKKDGPLEEENLMSVLELLELQARARAIRSQLMLEATKKTPQSEDLKVEDSDTDDAVIIEVPRHEEIVINSSDSESEQKEKSTTRIDISENVSIGDTNTQKKKITLIRDRFDKQPPVEVAANSKRDTAVEESNSKGDTAVEESNPNENIIEETEGERRDDVSRNSEITKCDTNKQDIETSSHVKEIENANDDDEIILIVDQEEMEGIIGD